MDLFLYNTCLRSRTTINSFTQRPGTTSSCRKRCSGLSISSDCRSVDQSRVPERSRQEGGRNPSRNPDTTRIRGHYDATLPTCGRNSLELLDETPCSIPILRRIGAPSRPRRRASSLTLASIFLPIFDTIRTTRSVIIRHTRRPHCCQPLLYIRPPRRLYTRDLCDNSRASNQAFSLDASHDPLKNTCLLPIQLQALLAHSPSPIRPRWRDQWALFA
jgi:hypothetical protein